MGLDITVYKNLKKVENPIFDEDGYTESWETQWQTPDESIKWAEQYFTGRSEGVELNTVYEYEESFDFRAGSYSGYGSWRSDLERLSDGKSFQELINFADNEGVIGYVVSNKLYLDFINNYDKAEQYSKYLGCEYGEYWFERYKCWLKAFEMAKENGAVDFH